MPHRVDRIILNLWANDPSTPENGEIWYNSTQNVVKFHVNGTTYILVPMSDAAHGNLSGGSLHAVATQSVNGFMSAADKAKLDSL